MDLSLSLLTAGGLEELPATSLVVPVPVPGIRVCHAIIQSLVVDISHFILEVNYAE